MRAKPNEYVRFYFGVTISYLIPPNPHGKNDSVPDNEWEENYLERVLDDMKAKLSTDGFEIAYRHHRPIEGALRLYASDFVVSALHMFPAAQILILGNDTIEFSVKKKYFSKTKLALETQIRELLKQYYVIKSICYEYAASRSFDFEVYMGGFVKVRYFISDTELKCAGGSVRRAINHFSSQVVKVFEEMNCIAEPKNILKRPKDSVYTFELTTDRIFSFCEHTVFGGLVMMTKAMDCDQAVMLGIDCDDKELTERISSLRDEIDSHCSVSMPPGTSVISLTLQFIDYEDDFVNYTMCLV